MINNNSFIIRKAEFYDYQPLDQVMATWSALALQKSDEIVTAPTHKSTFARIRSLPTRDPYREPEFCQQMACFQVAGKIRQLLAALSEEEFPFSKQEIYLSEHSQTGELLGVVTIREMPRRTPEDEEVVPMLIIQNLITHPNHLVGTNGRIIGIGKALLVHAEERAKEWGLHIFSLDALSVAIPFYRRNGYQLASNNENAQSHQHLMFKRI